MDFLILSLLGTTLLVYSGQASEVLTTRETLAELKDKSDHSIDYVDNDPEFLVGVEGLEKPLCFHTEGSTDQVVRLLQDPDTGVVVNARIFYDSLTNKTYLGAIVIAKGNLRLLAKQRIILINDVRYAWNKVNTVTIDGHRVIMGEDMVAVTFKHKKITLVVRRHFATPGSTIDYDELDKENPPTANSPSDTTTDSESSTEGESEGEVEADERGDVEPFGYEETKSLINRFLTPKGPRGILLHKYVGINQDKAVLRNVLVEVGSDGRKKRRSKEHGSDNNPSTNQRHYYRVDNLRPREHFPRTDFLRTEDTREENPAIFRKQHYESPRGQQHHYRSHLFNGRQKREPVQFDTEFVEKKPDRTIFLGMYVADSRDLSNKTHGLLGQFLFKNVTLEKIRYKNGRMKARLLINSIPSRRTIALLTLRRNMALNATRACWKIRHQGHDVIDGRYTDYLVPGLRYTQMKELPPTSPL